MDNKQNAVDEIKNRLSIVDVVSRYVKLKKVGNNFKGLSPFSNEKTPSFHVSPDKDVFYCFSTAQGGDIFSFIQKVEGVEFKEALKILADLAGVEIKEYGGKGIDKSEKDKLIDINTKAQEYFVHSLNDEITEYLNKRGLKNETIKQFNLGYAVDDWNKLSDFLKEKGFTDDEIEKVGLSKTSDKGHYDHFRDRVMFPIRNENSVLVGFAGRILKDKDGVGKYINTPGTILYNKSRILYGIDLAKSSIRNYDFSILVEGNFDVILSHQAGYTNTVAVCGTALTTEHIRLLQRYSSKLVMCFDGDEAGIKALLRNAYIPTSFGMEVKVAILPSGKDPADLILEDTEKWKEIIKKSKDIFVFMAELAVSKNKDEKIKLIREKLLPLVKILPDSVSKEVVLKDISKITDISQESLLEDLENTKIEDRGEDAVLDIPERSVEEDVLDAFAYFSDDREVEDKIVANVVEAFYEKVGFPEGYDVNVGVVRFTGDSKTPKEDAICIIKEKGLNLVIQSLLKKEREIIASKMAENEKREKYNNLHKVIVELEKMKV